MSRAKQGRVVLVTCGSPKEARRIAGAVVKKRLVACVNFVQSPVESIYSWKGRVEKAREYLLVMKTTVARLTELEREVKRLHGYELPEFIALPISEGSASYFAWLSDSVAKPLRKGR